MKKIFNITSTAKTSLNKTFIASIESNKYPFYGFQFHPEKSAFIWHSNVHLDHSIKSIKIT
ncbi:MAG: glutamine amidotransferase-related protein [bacterium]